MLTTNEWFILSFAGVPGFVDDTNGSEVSDDLGGETALHGDGVYARYKVFDSLPLHIQLVTGGKHF